MRLTDESLLPQIYEVVKAASGLRILYLNSLKSFGKKRGTEIYRQIKECVVNL